MHIHYVCMYIVYMYIMWHVYACIYMCVCVFIIMVSAKKQQM